MKMQSPVNGRRLTKHSISDMDEKVLAQILYKLKKYSVETNLNKSFSQLTTLGVGGKIALTAYPDTESKLVKTVRLLHKLGVQTYLLGKGSNVLASDDDFDGVVVVTTKLAGVRLKGRCVYALAGTSTVTLSGLLTKQGLSGGEFLACLPATIGGAVVGNAGCFGQDVKSVLRSVTVLKNGKKYNLGAKKCKLGKRNSIFKQEGYTVLSVKLRLIQSTKKAVSQTVADMREKKARTQPLNYRSAGCVLYHDTVALSRLIDEAGLKGYRIGGAEVSTKHAGFVLNIDKATAKDIYLVIQHVEQTLWEHYGVRAKREIRLVNFSEQHHDFFTERKKRNT